MVFFLAYFTLYNRLQFHPLFKKIFIYLAASGLSCGMQDLCRVTRDLSLQCTDSLAVVSGLWSMWALVVATSRLSSCGSRAFSSSAACGILVPQSVRDWTCILCIARQILNHWTTREVPRWVLSPHYLETGKPFILRFGGTIHYFPLLQSFLHQPVGEACCWWLLWGAICRSPRT